MQWLCQHYILPKVLLSLEDSILVGTFVCIYVRMYVHYVQYTVYAYVLFACQ